MGDFPSHVVSVPARPRFGRARAGALGVFALVLCLMTAGGSSLPATRSPALLIAGMNDIPSAPSGRSWAPAPIDADGLRMVAGADGQRFVLHTVGGDQTFLPGVDLGDTTPGHLPGGSSISAAQYRAWFAAMSMLGIRVVRTYTIHRPAFYQQLAQYNGENPDRPLYLMQGVALPTDAYITRRNLYDKQVTDAFTDELRDASNAVAGKLTTTDGAWDADVTPWLAGWIIGAELDPYAAKASDSRNQDAKPVSGRFFRSVEGAAPTEKWLAARMNELAGFQAAKGLSEPIAFVNWPATDPLRHPEEPLAQEDMYQLDANHVMPTANWPAGTFASYHAFPYYPDFLRREPGLQKNGDPYASYLAALHKHHAKMPTMITEFGVPSSIGSAHAGPLGRDQGGHSEADAMRIDADLLRVIKAQGLAGGFLFEWADEWYRLAWNTITHQDASRRQLWHDPLTNEQHFGLLATDPAGATEPQSLIDAEGGWPARSVRAHTDEAYLHLDVRLGNSPPGTLQLGFDVLPSLTGAPMAGSTDRRPDAVFALNLVGGTGQAYVRQQLDPLPLDQDVPEARRGRAPSGWRAYELLVGRKPIELQNAGLLPEGVLWRLRKDRFTVRVPWAMLGFADPSSHEVGVPREGKLTFPTSPGVTVSASASGTDQTIGQVTWAGWARPSYTERLKQGASAFRDAALSVSAG
ncbi:hypothetical protein ACFQS1_06010 [Paractinoplanes rhizophilus]|uniref:Uncharacterized protein n=1 Tax=Paractinoplanes rhizophilus TaxID=1416877 RepID=A0ABW2HLR4_9ACTN